MYLQADKQQSFGSLNDTKKSHQKIQ